MTATTETGPPVAPVTVRTRYVEALCIPYNAPTVTIDLPGYDGEIVAPGAFADFLARPDLWPKVRLTDTHAEDGRRPVGHGVEFYDQPNGLVGVFRLYDTPEGRGAGENITEETYAGVSVEFIVTREGNRMGLREVRAARLKALSLVDHPAYPEARILAKRRRTDAERTEALGAAHRIANAWTRTLAEVERDLEVVNRASDERLRERFRRDSAMLEQRIQQHMRVRDAHLTTYFARGSHVNRRPRLTSPVLQWPARR